MRRPQGPHLVARRQGVRVAIARRPFGGVFLAASPQRPTSRPRPQRPTRRASPARAPEAAPEAARWASPPSAPARRASPSGPPARIRPRQPSPDEPRPQKPTLPNPGPRGLSPTSFARRAVMPLGAICSKTGSQWSPRGSARQPPFAHRFFQPAFSSSRMTCLKVKPRRHE